MNRPQGFHQLAWESYLAATVAAGVNFHITQTVGDAALSDGYHLADGWFINDQGQREEYCAATDLDCRGATEPQITAMVEALTANSFAAWWRRWPNNWHIHCIFRGVKMKPELQQQVHDFMAGLNGLAGHGDRSQSMTATARVSVVAAARSCVHVRYARGGRSPQEGFDCYGLPYWALQQAGWQPHQEPSREIKNHVTLLDRECYQIADSNVLPADIMVLWQPQSSLWHVGLITEAAGTIGAFIHVSANRHYGSRVTENTMGAQWAARVVGVYRVAWNGER